VEFPGAVYHVTARGNERKRIFRDDEDRQRFLAALEEMAIQFQVHVLVFCLMPNHYHLVICTPKANLSRAVGWLQVTYTVRFNRRHRRSGHLFQGRFKAHLVEEDAYAISLMRYVHLNPVRIKGLKGATWREKRARMDAYKWSSHRFHAGLARPLPWLKPDWLRYYGARRAEAQAAYRQDVSRALENLEEGVTPWTNLRGGLVLGGKALWDKTKALLSGKSGQEEIRWSREQDQEDRKNLWRQKIDAEPDRRWKVWLRVRALGERKADVARELGYRDGSSVLHLLKRLQSKAQKDRAWSIKMENYERDLSSVKS
jgi:REP element-mobilizing transposase RayT